MNTLWLGMYYSHSNHYSVYLVNIMWSKLSYSDMYIFGKFCDYGMQTWSALWLSYDMSL